MQLRCYQQRAVDAVEAGWATWQRQLGVAACGAGKTIMFSHLAALNPGRTLILAHREELVNQAVQKLHAATGIFATVEKADQRAIPGHSVVVGSVQSMRTRLAKYDPDSFSLIIADECFVAGTMVEGVPIENMRIGDLVTTHHGVGYVTHLFRNPASTLCRLTFSGGRQLVCTPNHPIWTPDGFIHAVNLQIGAVALTIENEQLPNLQRTSETQAMRGSEMQKRAEPPNNSELVQDTRGRVNEIQEDERNGSSRSPCVRITEAQGYGMEAALQGREWDGTNGSSEGIGGCTGMGDGSGNCDSAVEGQWLSHLLQGGYWESTPDAGDRGRWVLSSSIVSPTTGRKENRFSEFVRLENIEVLESGGDGRFEQVCPDGFVYNLEVSNGNTYCANGVLVHNCHHCVSDEWQGVLSHFPNARVLGVTATPDRTDKRHLGHYFQNIAFEISLLELIAAGHLCSLRSMAIGTNVDLRKLRRRRKEVSLDDVSDALDPQLLEIARQAAAEMWDRKSLIFLPRCDISEKFAAALRTHGIDARHVAGNSEDRAECLAWFSKQGAGSAITNAMLLTEGYDQPDVDCILCLRPTQSRALYCQIIGRGTRTAKGKNNCLILDPLWMSGEMDLCRPADLTAPNVEHRQHLQAALDAGLDVLEAEEKAKIDCEAALVKKLEEAAKNRKPPKGMVDPLAWAVGIHDSDLSEYEPTMPWEEEPPTEEQVKVLTKAGLWTEKLTRGFAGKLMDRLIKRAAMGLASPKQVMLLRQFQHPNAETMTIGQAGEYIGRRIGRR